MNNIYIYLYNHTKNMFTLESVVIECLMRLWSDHGYKLSNVFPGHESSHGPELPICHGSSVTRRGLRGVPGPGVQVV